MKRLLKVPSDEQPIAIAAHAAVLALMLLAKPGTAEPTLDLTDAGVADVALLLVILGTAVIMRCTCTGGAPGSHAH